MRVRVKAPKTKEEPYPDYDKRKRAPPRRFQPYATGKSLSVVDAHLQAAEKEKNQALKRQKSLRKRLEKSSLIPTSSSSSSSNNLVKTTEALTQPKHQPSSISLQDRQNVKSTSLDQWQNQLTYQLNSIGIGTKGATPQTTQSLLSPVLITENGGLLYATSLLGEKQERDYYDSESSESSEYYEPTTEEEYDYDSDYQPVRSFASAGTRRKQLKTREFWRQRSSKTSNKPKRGGRVTIVKNKSSKRPTRKRRVRFTPDTSADDESSESDNESARGGRAGSTPSRNRRSCLRNSEKKRRKRESEKESDTHREGEPISDMENFWN
ncbi:Oidioi.mRNA.OKI2018_I69.chr1.g1347.t1.cds [Oikopleura dioica]|uniref:Oidioi.mRNA.OKI2018_I69.chr1.g1347.t1.cds n=1 Tax=Oikopleura dioica TaxID=34765 RepID=A0ABN7SSM8_OIKDI|nr:Oidioi.mRNA.OKI2018_I69.chr1.g1347.t1.cds [Oikopleura dioica]